jgi:uncharacterized membrane protein YbaN (DUF454 family)
MYPKLILITCFFKRRMAEYHHWFNSMGILNSMIVYDWFAAAQQLKQVLAQLSQMSSVAELTGLTMQSDKYKYVNKSSLSESSLIPQL